MSNPSQQVQQMMQALEGLLKQAQADPDAVQIDVGEARKVKELLDNFIAAKDQEQAEGGKGGKSGKSGKSGNGDDEKDEEKDKEDDDKDSSGQKKSPGY
jgi:hypothetical protein